MHMSSHQVALILALVLGVLGSDAVIDGDYGRLPLHSLSVMCMCTCDRHNTIKG